MKLNLIVLSAAFVFAASASHATPSETERYADWARVRSEPLLRAAGVDADAPSVSVRASVSLGGKITGIQVLHSSGSPDTDAAVVAVLRKIIWSKPPSGLVDGAVTLNVGKDAIVQAQAR